MRRAVRFRRAERVAAVSVNNVSVDETLTALRHNVLTLAIFVHTAARSKRGSAKNFCRDRECSAPDGDARAPLALFA